MTRHGKLTGSDSAVLAAIRTHLQEAGVVLAEPHSTSPLDFLIVHVDSSTQSLNGDGDFPGIAQMTPKLVSQLFQQNLTYLLLEIQQAVPALRARGGNIVILGTLHGLKLLPSPPHFAAAQSALHGITQSLAKELGSDNIRVNLLACGLINDESTRRLHARHRDTYLQHCALGRFAEATEIARAASWFALHNRYVSGQSIVLDGGL